MLTREMRDKWADALESREFAQITGTLVRSKELKNEKNFATGVIASGYCCLGVFGRACLGQSDLESQTKASVYNFFNENGLRYGEFSYKNDILKLTFAEIAVHVRALPVVEDNVAAVPQ